MLAHLHDLYEFYGELTGMRMARKHISWYTKGLKDSANFRHSMNTLQTIPLPVSYTHLDVYKRQEQFHLRITVVFKYCNPNARGAVMRMLL